MGKYKNDSNVSILLDPKGFYSISGKDVDALCSADGLIPEYYIDAIYHLCKMKIIQVVKDKDGVEYDAGEMRRLHQLRTQQAT